MRLHSVTIVLDYKHFETMMYRTSLKSAVFQENRRRDIGRVGFSLYVFRDDSFLYTPFFSCKLRPNNLSTVKGVYQIEIESFCPVVWIWFPLPTLSPSVSTTPTWVLGGDTLSRGGGSWGTQFIRVDRSSGILFSIIPLLSPPSSFHQLPLHTGLY
jgi:hypothetical protein